MHRDPLVLGTGMILAQSIQCSRQIPRTRNETTSMKMKWPFEEFLLKTPDLLWSKPWANFDTIDWSLTGTDKINKCIRVIDCELGHLKYQCMDDKLLINGLTRRQQQRRVRIHAIRRILKIQRISFIFYGLLSYKNYTLPEFDSPHSFHCACGLICTLLAQNRSWVFPCLQVLRHWC